MKHYLIQFLLILNFVSISSVQATPEPEIIDEQTIFSIFDQANTHDIETGKLGKKQGFSKQVRELGEMVVTDHTAVRQMARDLAKQQNITLLDLSDNDAQENHESTLAELKKLQGKEFDKAYLIHEIKFHQAVIDAIYDPILPSLENNVAFRNLIFKVIPGFKQHLYKTTKVAKSLGYVIETKSPFVSKMNGTGCLLPNNI